MIVEIFSSNKKSFFFALKELKDKIDKRFDSYDFLIFPSIQIWLSRFALLNRKDFSNK